MEECKKCLLRESAEEDVYESIKVRIDKLSQDDKADEALYDRRLKKCKE